MKSVTAGYIPCPSCLSRNNIVIDSRTPTHDPNIIRRRRKCLDCSHRFSTTEQVVAQNWYVQKKDHRIEPYSAEKLLKSIHAVTLKQNWHEDDYSHIQQEVESLFTLSVLISTRMVAYAVIDCLHRLDIVAYIRYASAYVQNPLTEWSEIDADITSYRPNTTSQNGARNKIPKARRKPRAAVPISS